MTAGEVTGYVVVAVATPGPAQEASFLSKVWRSIFGRATTGAADDVAIQFGKNANQVQHAFRHTDALGLDRAVVQFGVQSHLKTVASQITPGKPFNQVIEVGG